MLRFEFELSVPEVLCILYHLIMKREDYQEPEVKKTKPKIPSCVSPISMVEKDLRGDAGDRSTLFS